MNNNIERIRNYNNTFLGYLNSLVNDLNPSNDEMNSRITTSISNFRNALLNEGLDIAEDGIKTLVCNAFNEYIKIIMNHFDNSNIHKIDEAHENNEDINQEVNDVTTNLVDAVLKLNKTIEYDDLMNRVKSTLIGYFTQTFPNVLNVKEKSSEIINTYIISLFTDITKVKVDYFNSDILPTIIAIGDSIQYQKVITQEDVQEEIMRVNDERDAFIAATMDVEIEEGFENGVVTLKVTDQMGKTTLYEGREAMEKLISYNQLFEASRPGRVADISKWEHLLEAMYEEDKKQESSPVEVNLVDNVVPNNETVTPPTSDLINNTSTTNTNLIDTSNEVVNTSNVIDTTSNNNLVNNIVDTYNSNSTINTSPTLVNPIMNNNVEEENPNSDVNDLLNIISKNSNTDDTIPNQNEEIIKDFLSTVESPNNNLVNENSTPLNNDVPTNTFIDIIPKEDNQIKEINTGTISNNSLNPFESAIINPNNMNNIEEEEQDKEVLEIKSMMGIKEQTSDGSFNNFSFVPNYVNPNQDRDDFILKATGILIDEDVDNKGLLYLKVKEPSGREQVYTGKEAVNMIRNYNKSYLDANPGKPIDTSLIDNFKE